MRMNFGKKDEIGEIDFGKIRSGIKKDDIAKDNEALKSIFSKFDKNADGVLSSDEIDSIEEALKQAMGDDDNLSTREAKTLFDSKNRKEDAKNLFLFLKNLASTTVGIKSVSNPVNNEGIKEEVVYEDGRKEILYEDGSKVIETQIAEKSVVSKFNSKGKLVQVVETDNEGTVKTTDFDENGNLKKSQTVKNNGNYIETTKSINGRTLTTIENKELGLVQEYVEGELVKETRGKTVIQYHGSSRTETTIDGDWKQVDNYEGDVLKSKIVSDKTDDGKSKVVTTTYNGEDSVVDTRIDDKRVSQTKVINGVTYSINYDGEGNTKVIVQNGESIATLAKKFGCTVEEIISANPDKVKGRGANAYFLVGEEIKIPRELEADLPALQNRKSAEGAQADYKAYDDAIKAEQARQAEQAAAAKADTERAEEKQQREAEKARARELAQGFYDIADHNHGVKSMDKMLEFLKSNINSSNIVDFLNAYTDPEIRKKDSSIIDTITSEIGPGINKTGRQKAVLYQLINTLCNAARKAGVAEDTIKSLREAFVSSMNEELDNGAKRTDPTKMEIALDSLLGQIMAAKSGVKATSEDEAMQTVAGDFKETNDKATEDYDKAREEDSWIAKAGDTICGWFGCNTREEMRAKLGDNAKKVDALIEAANNGDKAEFKRIYKELFGVEFDPNLIAASEKANEDYMNAIIAQSQVEKMNTALSQIKNSMSFEEIANVIKNLYSNDSEINADGVINEIIKMYTDAGYPASTEEDKKSILLDFVNSTKEANQKVLDELTANKTLEELQREAEIIGKSAFGTNDISKMVNEFNQNMVMTDAIGTAAVEIGATVLLQFVPGLGQMAAARLAVSAAKWGVKGVKIAKYATKAGKFFKALSKLQSGTATASKVVNGVTRVATQAVTAGVATAGVGASKKEDAKTVLHRTLMNMSFAGAGATSNIIAPKLMQAFGISNQLATEIAEEIINAAAAYGISTVHGEAYGTQDAFLDFITGLVMARLAGAASARHAIKGAEIDANTPKPDVDAQPVRPEAPKADAQAKTASTDAPTGKAEAPKTENVASEKANKSESKSDVEPKTEAGTETKAEKKAERKVRADKLKDLRTRLGNKLARAYVKIENAIKNMKNAVDFDKISTNIKTKFANFKTEMNELLDKLNAKMKSLRESFGVEHSRNGRGTSASSGGNSVIVRPELDKYKPSRRFKKNLDHSFFVKSRPDLFDKSMREYGFWQGNTPKNQKHGAWKMHLFSVSEADWQTLCDVIIPYLKEQDIEWKTFNSSHTPEMLSDMQAGKAFTIYPRDNEHMAQIAKDLDYIIRRNKLETSNSHIIGDNQMGTTGRLFYRYEFNSGKYKDDILDLADKAGYNMYRDRYDANRGEGKYLADDMSPEDDIWRNFDPSNPNAKYETGVSRAQNRGNDYNRNAARAEAYAKFDKNQRSINLKGEGSLSRNAQYALDMNDLPELYLYDGTYLDFSQGELRARIENLAEGDFFTIGRQGDVVVGNEYISRQHILVTRHNGQIVIKDISANGGTYARTRNSGSANNNRKQASVDPKSNMISVFNKYLSDDMKLSNNATPEEIRKAYRKLSREHHSDKFATATDVEKKKHEEIFKDIASAYDDYARSIRK